MSSEISFKIPADKANAFQEFFEEFDEKLDELKILSYGISMTSLEEVFLKSNEATKSPEVNRTLSGINPN